MCSSCAERARAYQSRVSNPEQKLGLKTTNSSIGKYSLEELKEKLVFFTCEDKEYPVLRSAISVYKSNPNIYNDLLDPIMGFEP